MIQNVASGLYASNARNFPGEAVNMNQTGGYYSIRSVGNNTWRYELLEQSL